MSDDAAVLLRLLEARHSCRAFQAREVPRETIATWLGIAQRSASWCNTQPWRLVVTAGEATPRFRDALLDVADRDGSAPDFPFPQAYLGVNLDRRRQVGGQLYESLGIARGDRAASDRQLRENFRLFGAPHVAILTSDRSLGVYGAVDCGLYLGTLLLAAQALGLACIPQGAIARHSEFIRSHFGLGDDRSVVCGLSFGYADAAHPVNSFRTARVPLQEVVTWVDE